MGLRALIADTFGRPEVRSIVADPDRDNAQSHHVLEKAGFRRTRSPATAHWYEIGRHA